MSRDQKKHSNACLDDSNSLAIHSSTHTPPLNEFPPSNINVPDNTPLASSSIPSRRSARSSNSRTSIHNSNKKSGTILSCNSFRADSFYPSHQGYQSYDPPIVPKRLYPRPIKFYLNPISTILLFLSEQMQRMLLFFLLFN